MSSGEDKCKSSLDYVYGKNLERKPSIFLVILQVISVHQSRPLLNSDSWKRWKK